MANQYRQMLLLFVTTAFAVDQPSLMWSSTTGDYDLVARMEFCNLPNSASLYGYRDVLSSASGPCISPGPVIRLRRGTRYKLILANRVTTPTNLHTHGLHISAAGNADDASRSIPPGYCMGYNWTVPASHDGGTFWYHAHATGYVNAQVSGGAAGLIIVDDGGANGSIPTIPNTLNSSVTSNIVNFLNGGFSILCTYGSSYLCNGASSTRYAIEKGVWYRFRIGTSVSGGSSTTLKLDTTMCEVREIARDGVYVDDIPTAAAASWFMQPFGRLDFAVKCTSSTAFTWVKAKIYLDVSATGSTLTATPFAGGTQTWKPVRPAYLASMIDVSVVPANQMTVSITATGISLNGKLYGAKEIAATLTADAVYQITFGSTNGHPYHLHASHMQIINGCSNYYKGHFYDTITTGSNCVVKFRTPRFTGRLMQHCHVLTHEDGGAMTNFFVTGGLDAGPMTNPPVNASAACSA